MKVTIEKVFTEDKTNKYGRFKQVGLKIKEDTVTDINGASVTIGKRYIRGLFKPDVAPVLYDGDVAEIDIVQKGEFLNFKVSGSAPSLPSTATGAATGNTSLEKRVADLEAAVEVLNKRLPPPFTAEVDEIDDSF